jgi:hypothetical protein
MNLDPIKLTKKPRPQSIDDLEDHLKSLCDHMGFIKSSEINISNPKFLHYEDALDILKWNHIKRSFYGKSSN